MTTKLVRMLSVVKSTAFLLLFAAAEIGVAQSDYKVVPLSGAGKITGTVKWSGPLPQPPSLPITKDVSICDPDSQKTRDLERLIVNHKGEVANTIVFLKNITSGKAMDISTPRRFLDQRHCRYEPHILLVPENTELKMKSSDATLHTIHMTGAASYNLPFPFTNQIVSRVMPSAGVVNLQCNGGHLWMNAEMFVVPHPYFAVTDESGTFELSDVPPGEYQIVAWHEGWRVVGQQSTLDVLTQLRVQRPIFSEPRTWEQKVTVGEHQTTLVNFVLSGK
jgi:hypothetical protein